MFWHFYGRKSADRTKPHFDVIFFVFLSIYFGNLEVCYAKTFNIFWKYMSATWSTYLFWPFLHRGPAQLYEHFTQLQKFVVFQNIICSLFSPVFVLFSYMIDRYDAQGYPMCLEGHWLPLKPIIKCNWHTSAIYVCKK